MKKNKEIDWKKLFKRIDKHYIGYIYGYLVFILFFSCGVVIGRNVSDFLYGIANYTLLISFIVAYPITLIRYKASEIRRKERKELAKEVKDNEKD